MGLIKPHKGGSGDSEYLRWVHCYSEDGTSLLGSKPVAVGDDCRNPVTAGYVAKPTKAPDDAYNYSHSGWALEANSEAVSSDALKEVEENRNVYAVFNKTARTYTITFLDADGTTLKTVSAAYGSTPNYTPAKENHIFVGWEPEIVPVTGDATYSATWLNKITFGNASWDNIIAMCNAGYAAQNFNVGDEKTETLVIDGVSETVTFIIAGFGVSTLKDGTTKDNISIITKHALSKKRTMHGTYSGASYYNTALAAWLNGDLFACLPTVLQNGIKEKYIYKNGSTIIGQKCWLVSGKELGVPVNTYWSDYETYSQSLPIFTDNASRVKTLGMNGEAVAWYTRGYTWQGNDVKFLEIKADGSYNTSSMTSPTTQSGIVFGFCV